MTNIRNRVVVEVENVKCGGCEATIKKVIGAIDADIGAVNVDFIEGTVSVEADASVRPQIVAALRGAGYPEVDTAKGIAKVGLAAQSYVSCAIGKFA